MLIEQDILVLPHSRTPTVDVRISFANRRTGGLREFFLFSQIFSGPGILQSSCFFRPPVDGLFRFPAHHLSLSSSVRYQLSQPFTKPLYTSKYPGFWSQSGCHYAKPSRNLGLNINGTLCEGGNVPEKVGHL